MLTLRNSRGADWGDGGYTYISYDEFAKYVIEACTISDEDQTHPTDPKCCCIVV